MLRAAAKNFKHVTTIVHPSDYNEVIQRIKEHRLDESYRKSLMIKVFEHTNEYDHAIVSFFKGDSEELRYGENPQQSARLFVLLIVNILLLVLNNCMVRH